MLRWLMSPNRAMVQRRQAPCFRAQNIGHASDGADFAGVECQLIAGGVIRLGPVQSTESRLPYIHIRVSGY